MSSLVLRALIRLRFPLSFPARPSFLPRSVPLTIVHVKPAETHPAHPARSGGDPLIPAVPNRKAPRGYITVRFPRHSVQRKPPIGRKRPT